MGNHTQLDGAVIDSTASADKNRLDTGTLGFNDIHNQAEFETSHVGGGKSASELTEAEKQELSTLATVAGGLAAGLVGNTGTDAVAGAKAGQNAVENNYLSTKQQAQKDKEIAECQSMACKVQMQAKWTAIDLGQDGSFAAGMVAGVPAGLYDAVDGIVKTASSPVETYEALKTLFNSGDVLGNVSDAVKQSYIDRIDRMEAEYQKAGASGSFNAGVEGGKLVTDIAGLLAGGAGVVKGGAVLTERVTAKVLTKAEAIASSSGNVSELTKLPITSISNVKAISAAEANSPFIEKGWNAPYDSATQVRTFTTTSDITFMRVSTPNNPIGAFLVRADEIVGMTREQIQQHLALPNVPTQVAEVTVPAGTRMQAGKVAAQPEFGAPNSGGVQYQLLQQIPTNSFGTPRSLK
ncbi:VENN motif pre-toxin domain-containing protein [Pectobacteriaceae bacterium CE90]|nr:VENN motif pre-toxin domain-containing protein [Pectobacteriaceae bacterium CE90]